MYWPVIACPTCTYVNDADRDDCEMCRAPLFEADPPHTGGPHPTPSAPAVACPTCTAHNESSRRTCVVCGDCLCPEDQAKTAELCVALSSAECPRCATANSGCRTDCVACGAVLRPEPGRGPGDILPKNDGEKMYFRCPHKGCDVIHCVFRAEINCTIFICGADRRTGAQVGQHDEAAAAALKRLGFLVGCGGQYRIDKKTMAVATCTGH